MTIAKILVALVFIFGNYYAYNYLASSDVIPERVLFSEFPDEIGDWTCLERQDVGEKVVKNLGVTDYLLCDYRNGTSGVAMNLYIGYHETQARSDAGKTTLIHPPEHCLPGAGWDIISSKIIDVEGDASPNQIKRVVIAKGEERNLVYFWYHSRGRKIASGFDRVTYMFIDRALRSRTDGSLMRFTIPIVRDDVEAADAAFEQFQAHVVDQIGPFVPN